ncbi:hypothetical protein [Sabulibacter ruber]|uniref:hypothetical protein n=1 Tax=Sabulibacter ruber TaxID=2811901 RepID=UPI001A964FE9|nr:hypothetical protein [Sabulibacter ruber]
MSILYQTDLLLLENQYEVAVLTDKRTGQILLQEEFYGDPVCGLIDNESKWAIIAGETLSIWTPGWVEKIDDKDLSWVHALRCKGKETIELLVDPWGDKSSIWELSTNTFTYGKAKDFNVYRGKEYIENVLW